ncbi:sigma-70 family RNA polymerase sigma factor [Streptomyces phaeochromogenes]|uniref:sigma-70 family RNA polymerase sigma factor n=1 Tax=Streptomyces phaeochromogenes TaxID=1923 RepID=UPI00367D05ED
MDELQQTRTTAAQGLALPQVPDTKPEEPDVEKQQDFSKYYAEHMGKLIRHLMRQGAEPHEAAEAAQSAFVEAYGNWRKIEYPGPWLRRVAFRLLLRQPIREVLSGELPDTASPQCPVRNVEIRQEEERVLAALSELPPAQRQVMAWHLDNYSTKEIAEELEATQEAVRKNLERARKQLKQSLGIAEGGKL